MASPNAQSVKSRARADLMRIFAAAVSAVAPRRVIAAAFDGQLPEMRAIPEMLEKARRVYLLAAGKAAMGMALEMQERIGANFHDAFVIAPRPLSEEPSGKQRRVFRIMPAAHPAPDESSEAAGRAALEFVGKAERDDLVVFLLSGGASALIAVPAEGLTFADKVTVTTTLMNTGASIRELNTVRRHLSGIKGGRLLQSSNANFLTLILSDVPGNDLATIGSGPTAADPTTYSDAIAVMKRRGLWGRAPESVRDHLERGAAGEFDETLKPGDPVMARVKNLIVGDNGAAIAAAVETAIALGYAVERGRELNGEANDVGRALAAHLATIERARICVIAGGEPVVTVKGSGKGGRAQQCALAMALELARIAAGRRIAAIFAGTDGVDGPTDAAGAIVTPLTVERGSEAGLDAQAALERNDSYTFFKALGDLVIIGPTGTNVADIFVGLVNY